MDVFVSTNKELNDEEWDRFVYESPQGNIYHLYAYLDNLLDDWQVVVVREGGRIVAAFPFVVKTKWGISYAMQPYFAQYLGILFGPKSENVYKDLEFQKKAIKLIHDALPEKVKYFDYNFAPEFDYELPLQWLGWRQRTLYTYWVDIEKGYESVLQSCASHVRREIKKADQANLRVQEENNPELVVEILKTAKPEAVRQIHEHFFKALCKNARNFHEQGKSCCLIGYEADKPIAGIIYFFHREKMIYYQGSTLPACKNSGIMSKIIAEGIRRFGHRYRYLDFDGSMIEPIERFFRGFGAYPVRYSNFTLNRLPLLPRIVHRLVSGR